MALTIAEIVRRIITSRDRVRGIANSLSPPSRKIPSRESAIQVEKTAMSIGVP
ncbi:hypothetical protein [Thermococcus sp.]